MLGLNLSLTGLIALAIRGRGAFSADFLAAYPALTDAQDVGVEGDILNLMPIGAGTSTSTHADAILALDADGVYQSYPANEPVWRGARVVLDGAAGSDVAASYSTDVSGDDISPHPWLQGNEAGTNSQTYSNDLTNAAYTATTTTVAKDEAGIDGVTSEACTLTATGVNSTVIAGAITAASANHVTKWLIKRKTGTGAIELTTDGGTTWQSITLTSDFDVFTVDQAAVTNPSIGIRIVTSGDAVIVGNAEAHLATTIVAVEALPPIITTTIARTISATSYNHNLANIDTDNSATALEFIAEGESFNILTIGSQVLLSYNTTDGLVLDDGTLSSTYPIATGDHTVGIALGNEPQPELVVNGGFDTDLSGWTDSANNWEWSADGADCLGANDANLNQDMGVVQGKAYAVSFEVKNYVSGLIALSLGESFAANRLEVSADGVHTATMIAGGSTSFLYMYPRSTPDYTIDNISVKEVVNTIQLTIDGTIKTELTYSPLTAGLITMTSTHFDLRSDIELSYAAAQSKVLAWVS